MGDVKGFWLPYLGIAVVVGVVVAVAWQLLGFEGPFVPALIAGLVIGPIGPLMLRRRSERNPE